MPSGSFLQRPRLGRVGCPGGAAAEAGDVAAARAAYAKAISLTTDIPTRRWLEARRADLTAR
jgi:predicted RNA polymerase sigma factor